MRFLVFQHIAIEHPGIFRDFFAADGIEWDAVEWDEGQTPPPSLDGYDALWAMGGPMHVWEKDQHPWLTVEMAAIRAWVDAGKPYLGLCFGHQLLGLAMGGQVELTPVAEIGVLDVYLTEAGKTDRLMAGIAPRFRALQWHSAAVTKAPAGATILASSDVCPNQAMRIGERAWSLQYHVELTPTTVGEWGEIPAYSCAMADTLGEGALALIEAEAKAEMPNFNRDSRLLYENFMAAIR